MDAEQTVKDAQFARSEWQPADTAPNGVVVYTKIHDESGARNHGLLSRSGNLWFLPDGSMYVYYRPTHWRPKVRP